MQRDDTANAPATLETAVLTDDTKPSITLEELVPDQTPDLVAEALAEPARDARRSPARDGVPAARQLGHLWTEDLCFFTDVTIGLGRLQRMMRELSPAFGTEVAHPPNGRRVLLVRAPGEQHSFGLSMVAEFFRRAGWEVAAGGEGADADPITAVRREWFDVVGFSAGSEARLDWLPSCIAAVRRASVHPDIAVLVGGPVFTLRPQLARQLGADATASDGSEAPGLAESLLAGRVKRS